MEFEKEDAEGGDQVAETELLAEFERLERTGWLQRSPDIIGDFELSPAIARICWQPSLNANLTGQNCPRKPHLMCGCC